MISKKYLIVLSGPTAIGKSKLSIELAQYFDTEIIAADSRQIYEKMNIGTAKVMPVEMQGVPHHLIGFHDIETPYSVGDYEQQALGILEEVFAEKDVAIVSGGTGFFIRALCDGLDEFPEVPNEIREELNGLLKNEGLEVLQKKLLEKDPAYYEVVDLQNPMRVIRALEVVRASGRPFSDFHKKKKVKRSFEPIYVCLEIPREQLYGRINLRVDQMVENGLIEEAKSLHPYRELNALQTVGYQELFDYFEGKTNLEYAIELIKRNSRRYAKRQMTWFRKDEHWNYFHPKDKPAIIEFIKKATAGDINREV